MSASAAMENFCDISIAKWFDESHGAHKDLGVVFKIIQKKRFWLAMASRGASRMAPTTMMRGITKYPVP